MLASYWLPGNDVSVSAIDVICLFLTREKQIEREYVNLKSTGTITLPLSDCWLLVINCVQNFVASDSSF
jgi:hypothetical protein